MGGGVKGEREGGVYMSFFALGACTAGLGWGWVGVVEGVATLWLAYLAGLGVCLFLFFVVYGGWLVGVGLGI